MPLAHPTIAQASRRRRLIWSRVSGRWCGVHPFPISYGSFGPLELRMANNNLNWIVPLIGINSVIIVAKLIWWESPTTDNDNLEHLTPSRPLALSRSLHLYPRDLFCIIDMNARTCRTYYSPWHWRILLPRFRLRTFSTMARSTKEHHAPLIGGSYSIAAGVDRQPREGYGSCIRIITQVSANTSILEYSGQHRILMALFSIYSTPKHRIHRSGIITKSHGSPLQKRL